MRGNNQTHEKGQKKETHLEHAPKLLNTLQNQLLVWQNLPALHNTDNGCINGIAPVLINILYDLLLLIHRWQWNLSTNILT
jgi:hypothetical protein